MSENKDVVVTLKDLEIAEQRRRQIESENLAKLKTALQAGFSIHMWNQIMFETSPKMRTLNLLRPEQDPVLSPIWAFYVKNFTDRFPRTVDLADLRKTEEAVFIVLSRRMDARKGIINNPTSVELWGADLYGQDSPESTARTSSSLPETSFFLGSPNQH